MTFFLMLGVMLFGGLLVLRNLLRRGNLAWSLYTLGALLFSVGFFGSVLAYMGVI